MTSLPAQAVSSPALILTIGSALLEAAAESVRLFLQGDPRRSATTRFLGLGSTNDAKEERPRRNPVREKTQDPSSQVFMQINGAMDVILPEIRSSLHELRSHVHLMVAGLGDKASLPLDVFVLADLTEPASTTLPAILPLLNELLLHEPYAKLHLLLNVAVFDDTPSKYESVRTGLEGLQALLKDGLPAGMPQVYLFDRYKEGVWEAYDLLEIQTVMGNFLMALLSGGLAQHLAHQVAQPEVEEHQAYFCSAGATALILDLPRLQQACALRLAAEIIQSEFHSSIMPDPILVREAAANFCEEHANPRLWMEHLCRESMFHVPPGEGGLELHFSDLKFEGVPWQDWVAVIRNYDVRFSEMQYPAQVAMFQSNAEALNRAFLDGLSSFVQRLPQLPKMYPGGVRAARVVIAQLKKELLPARLDADLPRKWEADEGATLASSLERLEGAIQALPKPPRWISRLPSFLRSPAVQLFNLIFLYRELNSIRAMRQACVRRLKETYEALAQSEIARQLHELCRGWSAALDTHEDGVARMQAALDKFQQQFTDRGAEISVPQSQFRLTVADEALFAWAYYSGSRPAEGFRHGLLEKYGFLSDWQETSPGQLKDRLEHFCMAAYQSLAGMDLEQALQHRADRDAVPLALSLLQGSTPLLRPNFDQTGSGHSHQLRFFQCRQPLSSSLAPTFKGDVQEWEMIHTGDLYTAICCRVRLMIASSAIRSILDRGGLNPGI